MTQQMPAVMRTPRELDIALTSKCNLRCHYCYFFDNPEIQYTDLPAAEWLKFFEELGQLAVMKLSLAGGEPFIYKDLPAIIEGIVRNRMRFSLLSNGTLIDDDIAAFIAKTNRCDYVQVSLDGSTAAIHETARGRGSFANAVRGLKILKKHGISAAVRVTIHHQNVHDLDNIAHFLLVELGLPSFSTNSAGHLGSCCLHADELQLTVQDRQEAMAALLRLNQQYPGRINAQAGPLAEARMWQRMIQSRETGKHIGHPGGSLTACGCPNNKIAVRSDGVITPCTMLSHIELGRINQDSLQEIWLQHPELYALRVRNKIPLQSFEFCAGCEYVDHCTGNCPGLAYSITGKVDHPSPDACLRRYLAQGGQIPRN